MIHALKIRTVRVVIGRLSLGIVCDCVELLSAEFPRPCDDPRIKNTHSSCCDWSLVSQLALFALMHCLCLCRVSEFLSF